MGAPPGASGLAIGGLRSGGHDVERVNPVNDLEVMKARVETPAFVYDEGAIADKLRVASSIRADTGCKVLYAMKPLALVDALRLMAAALDGLAASSLFEATLAYEVLAGGGRGTVHVTTPGFRPDEIAALDRLCNYVAFNSLGQWERYGPRLSGARKCGLRVNPKLPLVEDERYNPCRPGSKLGAPIEELEKLAERQSARLQGLAGLHFHTNCDSESFDGWLATVERLDERLDGLLRRLAWVNLGGGYLLDAPEELPALARAVGLLRSKYGVEVFIEPGAAFVRDAGYIIASVIDLFTCDGREIAVLDTTVNHMPEVFEYQFEPEVEGHDDDAEHEYTLAGCTCLAGDVFGDYAFDEPLEVGARVVFTEAGAYTTVKSHMFNGVNMPAIYACTDSGELVLKKRFSYGDFRSRCGE
jgi:carboxynorspermidine decarboxylase